MIKSSTVLNSNHARVRIIIGNAAFAGGLEDIAKFYMKEYDDFTKETKIPMICNEFGTNNYSFENSNGAKYLYDILSAALKYNVNISLFSYAGFDFGLMYDYSRDFGTEKSQIRQTSYDALYNAIHQDTSFDHVFKYTDTMKKYDCQLGDKVLVLGENFDGNDKKVIYTITNSKTDIKLDNGLYAKK